MLMAGLGLLGFIARRKRIGKISRDRAREEAMIRAQAVEGRRRWDQESTTRRVAQASVVFLFLAATTGLQASESDSPVRLPALGADAKITRDADGIAHIRASNRHDLLLEVSLRHAIGRDPRVDLDVEGRIGNSIPSAARHRSRIGKRIADPSVVSVRNNHRTTAGDAAPLANTFA
jgi:hypothetical protein